MLVAYTFISCKGYTNVSQTCKRNTKYYKCTNLHRAGYWPNESIPNFEAAAANFVPTNYKKMCYVYVQH